MATRDSCSAGPEQRLKTASDLKRPARPIVALRRDSHRGSAPQESRFMPFVAELSDLPRRPLWKAADIQILRFHLRNETPGDGRRPVKKGRKGKHMHERSPVLRIGLTWPLKASRLHPRLTIAGAPAQAWLRQTSATRSQRSWIREGAVRQRGCGEAGGGCGGAEGDLVLNKKPESQTDALSDAAHPQTPPSE